MQRCAALLLGATLTSAPARGAGPRVASPPVLAPPRDTLWLENAGIRLGFDPRDVSLLESTDRATAQSFLPRAARTRAGIWQLDRLTPGVSGLVPTSARTLSWQWLARETAAL